VVGISVESEGKNLVLAVRACFPAESEATDSELTRRGYEVEDFLEIPTAWIECFADRTTEAVFARASSTVKAHTNFFAEQFLSGCSAVRDCVDVYYAEPLLWNASEKDKQWAWQHIAGPIRQLHEDMWGAPHC
jgi:hypothetical protein